MDIQRIDDYAGLRRELEIGLSLAPTRAIRRRGRQVHRRLLDDEPRVAVRLAGLGSDDSRILITLAVTLGTIDEIKVADPRSRTAVLFLQRIIDELSAYDPAFVTLPAPTSFEARAAALAMASRRRVRREHGRAARRDRLVDGVTVQTTTSSSPPATGSAAGCPTWSSAAWTSGRSSATRRPWPATASTGTRSTTSTPACSSATSGMDAYTRQWSDGQHRVWVPEGQGYEARERIRAWCAAHEVEAVNIRVEAKVPFRDLDQIPRPAGARADRRGPRLALPALPRDPLEDRGRPRADRRPGRPVDDVPVHLRPRSIATTRTARDATARSTSSPSSSASSARGRRT